MREVKMAKEYVLVDRQRRDRDVNEGGQYDETEPVKDTTALAASINPFQNPFVKEAKERRRALAEIVADTRLTAEEALEKKRLALKKTTVGIL